MGLFSKNKQKTEKKEYYTDGEALEAVKALLFGKESGPEPLYDVCFDVGYLSGSDDWGLSTTTWVYGIDRWEIRRICNLRNGEVAEWAEKHGLGMRRYCGQITVYEQVPARPR